MHDSITTYVNAKTFTKIKGKSGLASSVDIVCCEVFTYGYSCYRVDDTLFNLGEATMSKATLTAVYNRHNIDQNDRRAFTALVVNGKRPGKELRKRLTTGYKAALNDVLASLSAPYAHLFA